MNLNSTFDKIKTLIEEKNYKYVGIIKNLYFLTSCNDNTIVTLIDNLDNIYLAEVYYDTNNKTIFPPLVGMPTDKKSNIKKEKEKLYKIIKKISDKIFLVEKNNKKFIKKIIKRSNHPWNNLPSFNKFYPNNKDLFDRIIFFNEKMDELGYGPTIDSYIKSLDYLIIFMEYLPNKITEEIVEKRENEIVEFIGSLHEKGYIHGDLHSGNIMLDDKENLKLIDFETMFQLNEILTNPLPQEWIEYGFDETNLLDFIEYEKTDNFKSIA